MENGMCTATFGMCAHHLGKKKSFAHKFNLKWKKIDFSSYFFFLFFMITYILLYK